MVSPLQSIAANLRPAPNAGMMLGDIISRGRQQEASLQGQNLQNQLLQQRVDAGNAPPEIILPTLPARRR